MMQIGKIKKNFESTGVQGFDSGIRNLSELSKQIKNTPLIKLKQRFIKKSRDIDFLTKKNQLDKFDSNTLISYKDISSNKKSEISPKLKI